MAYAPCNNEVDLSQLIQTALAEGKQVALPLSLWEKRQLLPVPVTKYPEDLTPGRCGILEPQLKVPPLPLEKLDLVLVPGVAFDVNGYRLGYGQGFCDRFLRDLKPAPGSSGRLLVSKSLLPFIPKPMTTPCPA